jgi:hypothetical protein
MNYPRYREGEKVVPRGKRVGRVVLKVRRIAGCYEYLLLAPHNREETAWEHQLQTD